MLVDAMSNDKVLKMWHDFTLKKTNPMQQPKCSQFVPSTLSNAWSAQKSALKTTLNRPESHQPSLPDASEPQNEVIQVVKRSKLSTSSPETSSTNADEISLLPKAEFRKVEDEQTFDKNQFRSTLTPNTLLELNRAKKISKLTKTLVSVLFTREILQRTTLAGKKNDGGNVLDADKVQKIVGYVSQCFPVTKAAIRNQISQKIKDEKQACKKKMKNETQVE